PVPAAGQARRRAVAIRAAASAVLNAPTCTQYDVMAMTLVRASGLRSAGARGGDGAMAMGGSSTDTATASGACSEEVCVRVGTGRAATGGAATATGGGVMVTGGAATVTGGGATGAGGAATAGGGGA